MRTPARTLFVVAFLAFVLPVAAQQFPAKDSSVQLLATNNDTPEPKDVSPPVHRFLGWQNGFARDPGYLRRFARPRARQSVSLMGSSASSRAQLHGETLVEELNVASAAPGLALRRILPSGFIPSAVTTGDFNRDGRADLAATIGGEDSVWIYLGRGDGSFDLPSILPLAGSAPAAVVAADLRGRGILDLIVAEVDTGTVNILPGRGDGTFDAQAQIPLPVSPIFIAVQDVDLDSRLDLIVGLAGDLTTGPFAVLLGDGQGNFSSPLFAATDRFYFGRWLAVGDANRDGFSDVLVTGDDPTGGSTQIFVSRGDGSFQAGEKLAEANAIGRAPTTASLGDLNADGCADAVVNDTFGLSIVFLSRCDGTFDMTTLRTYGAGDLGYASTIVDINRDGNLDVLTSGFFAPPSVFGSFAGNLLSVRLGGGDGTLQSAEVFRGGVSMFSLAVADFNGDGWLDVTTADQDSDSISVFLNDQTSGFGFPRGRYVGYQDGSGLGGTTNVPASLPVVVDLDGNGTRDLALLGEPQFAGSPYSIVTLLNQGSGRFSERIRSEAFTADLRIGDFVLADFNNDTRPDFLAIGQQFDSNTEFITFAPNSGAGSFEPATRTLRSGAAGKIGVGDFNQDGRLDFVAFSFLRVTVFLGNGNGTFNPGMSQNFPAGTSGAPFKVFAGDFNRDSRLDLLVRTQDTSGPSVLFQFLGNGDGTFQPGRLLFDTIGELYVADVSNDASLDLIATDAGGLQGSPRISVYRGQPDGSFALSQTYTPYTGIWMAPREFVFVPAPGFDLGIADYDGDGRLDVPVFQTVRPFPRWAYVQFLKGNGDGTFTPTFNVTRFFRPITPQSGADLDQDGFADMIELNKRISSLNVIPGTPAPALQLSLLADPVVGTQGRARVSRNIPTTSPTSVTLSASDPAIQVPVSVTIPPGAVSQDFAFTLGAGFDSRRMFFLRGAADSESAFAFSTQADGSFPVGVGVQPDRFFFVLFPGQDSRTNSAPNHVAVVSVGGYGSSFQLECLNLPGDVICAFDQETLDVPNGGSNFTRFGIVAGTNAPPGIYTIQIAASDGLVTSVQAIQLTITGDFSIAVTPSTARTVPVGTSMYQVTLTSLVQVSSPAVLTCTNLPQGAACDVNGSALEPLPQGNSLPFRVITQGTLAGDYSITLTATGGPFSHSTVFQLQVGDFSGTVSSNSATIPVGSSAQFNLSVISLNGFTDQLTFSCVSPTTSVSCSFNPLTANLDPNGSTNTVLTVAVASRPPSGALFTASSSLLASAVFGVTGLLLSGWTTKRARAWSRSCRGIAVLALAGAALVTSCGGGGETTSVPPPPPPPPPPVVTVNLTVRATSPSFSRDLTMITIRIP